MTMAATMTMMTALAVVAASHHRRAGQAGNTPMREVAGMEQCVQRR